MFKLQLETDNAAFCDDAASGNDDAAKQQETARILRQIAAAIAAGRMEGRALDVNGNTVGKWTLS